MVSLPPLKLDADYSPSHLTPLMESLHLIECLENSGKLILTTTAQDTEEWYKDYYKKKGDDRNNILKNHEVLYQHLAFIESMIRSLQKMKGIEPETAEVLDVGCGDCASLAMFLQLGFMPHNLHGVDILEDRVARGHARYPGFQLTCDDASEMSFPSASFDIVTESTMFVQITDESLAKKIAAEMLRVCRPGGYLLLIDWRYGKPGNDAYKAVSMQRIRSLFEVGNASELVCVRRGALLPPIGRFLSKTLPSLYFLVRGVMPVLAGSTATLLKRI